MLDLLEDGPPKPIAALPCALCQLRLTGRCPGGVEAAAIHGDFFGFHAMPMAQALEYGVCGEASLFMCEGTGN
jgi:hypothetical protein